MPYVNGAERVPTHHSSHRKRRPKGNSNGEIEGNLIWAVEKDPTLINRIVTGDENGVFHTTLNPKELRQRRNHYSLRTSRYSALMVRPC
ncbi:hypothetical protein TNCV_3554871 [Trichonephila clavipes]|nr:hypothetical protein TNCV_3554871 [Trichonephila clavipes]